MSDIIRDKTNCLIFLSWQSDRKECRNFITSVLDKLPECVSDFASISIDRDTVNVPGAPDIGDTIFEKIDQCDLFIADITLINDKDSNFRRTPNPNVLIELGYAIKTLGWERIVLLQCCDYGEIEELPFDINHRRICNFSLGQECEDADRKSEITKKSKAHTKHMIAETIRLLQQKGLLFGGRKKRVPKFEICWLSNNGCMSNLTLQFKNVSTILVSSLESHGLVVIFSDGSTRKVDHHTRFIQTSLMTGEQTQVQLNNQILGAGPGNSNAVWDNFTLQWQFSCEDELGTVYWYQMEKHVPSAGATPNGKWPVKYIG